MSYPHFIITNRICNNDSLINEAKSITNCILDFCYSITRGTFIVVLLQNVALAWFAHNKYNSSIVSDSIMKRSVEKAVKRFHKFY